MEFSYSILSVIQFKYRKLQIRKTPYCVNFHNTFELNIQENDV